MSPRNPYHRKAGRPRPQKVPTPDEVAREVQRLKSETAKGFNYRARSLEIHGMICAKCGREFSEADKRLLTVHHIDGNDQNNPPDGSNWENLCIYCHDDEHSRTLLGDYLQGKPPRK